MRAIGGIHHLCVMLGLQSRASALLQRLVVNTSPPCRRASFPEHDVRVDCYIDDKYADTQQDLCVSCEAAGINDCDHVALDKSAAVAGFAAERTQMIFEWCERADASGKHHVACPCGGTQMHDGKPARNASPQQKRRAHDRKRNEREVEDDHGVGEKAIEHGPVNYT